jgi:hypothetical protein
LADGSPVTQARRTRALLKRLAELRLVVRLGRTVGGRHAGSSGFVYGLSGHGQAVLAIDGPMGGRRRRVWEVEPTFLHHVLDVAEIYVRLVEAERTGTADLLDFQAEPACWRRFPGTSGQAVTLKPDAYVNVGAGDLEHSAFVEVDRGTESAPTIARKCQVFIAYWRSGIEQRQHGVFPLVVWLASNPRGVTRIAEVVRQLPQEVRHLFEVALHGDAVATLTTAVGGRCA